MYINVHKKAYLPVATTMLVNPSSLKSANRFSMYESAVSSRDVNITPILSASIRLSDPPCLYASKTTSIHHPVAPFNTLRSL